MKTDSFTIKQVGGKPAKEKEDKIKPLDEATLKKYKGLLRELDDQNNEDEDWGYTPERKKIVRGLIALGSNIAPYLEKELKNGGAEKHRKK